MNYFTLPGIPYTPLKSITSIFRVIEKEFQVSEAYLSGTSRKRELVLIRQLFCYVLCLRSEYTLTEIGKALNRDHTTVMYSRDTFKDLLDIRDAGAVSAWSRLTSKI